MITACAVQAHENPYPPPQSDPGPSSRLRRWYEINWPPIAGMTSYVLAVGLLAADLITDWTVSSSALPGYAALLAAGTAGAVLGRRP